MNKRKKKKNIKQHPFCNISVSKWITGIYLEESAAKSKPRSILQLF
jgi:hypothetical protein